MNGKDSALFSKASDEWETPQWLFDLLDREFHFQVDAAATNENKKCMLWFGDNGTGEYCDALEHPWHHVVLKEERFFLNPPYSKIAAFMQKAYEESQKGATVVCLIPARTDTRYFHDYCMKALEIRFIKGRLKFGGNSCAPFPSIVVIFKKGTYTPTIGKTIEQPRSTSGGVGVSTPATLKNGGE